MAASSLIVPSDPVRFRSRSEATAALDRVCRAFDETRRLPAWRRSDILSGTAAILADEAEALARVICDEAAKPIRDARMEVQRAITTFTIAAEEARRIHGEFFPLDGFEAGSGRTAVVARFPIGPVLAITPFNFPLNLVAHKVAPALAVGNSVIVRPSSTTPRSAMALARAVAQAGWPEDGIAAVPCAHEAAEEMLGDPRVKKLSFTGSSDVGEHLERRAAGKKVTLELGGNAGAIVHEDCDLQFAAKRCTVGAFSYAGQVCISVQRIFVHQPVAAEFTDALLGHVAGLVVGDPADEATDIGPMITQSEAERTEAWVSEAVASGARVLVGGERDGRYHQPTVLTDVCPEMRVCCEEAFAPLVTLSTYTDFEEAVRLVDDSKYGLQAGVFTRDIGRIQHAFANLNVGGVIINDVPTYRVDEMPYGGVKASGHGREGVRYAIQEMTEPRLLVLNTT